MEQKQKLEESVRKRITAEERAFKVVLRLIEETSVSEDYLADAGQMIISESYSDVVEERAIIKLCGYPLCGSTLKSFPNQKYHISTRTNKVFEISDRKKFCSNHCYQASKHFAKQISTSPVWARDETTKVKFTFLAPETKQGLVGEEVFWSPRDTLAKEIDKLKALDELLEKKNHTGENKKEKKSGTREKQQDEDSSTKSDKSEECLTASSIVEDMASLMLNCEEKKSEFKHISEEEISGKVEQNVSHIGKPEQDVLHTANPKQKVSHAGKPEQKVFHTGKLEQKVLHTGKSEEKMSHTDKPEEKIINTDKPEEKITYTHKPEEKITHTNKPEEKITHTDKPEQNVSVTSKDDVSCNQVGKRKDSYESKTFQCVVEKENSVETDNSLSAPLPGESNSDFVLRLLDKRKHLLSKMADVQRVVNTNEDKNENRTKHNSEVIPTKISTSESKTTDDKNVHVRSGNKKHGRKSKKGLSPLTYVGDMVGQWMTKETLEYLKNVGSSEEEKVLKSTDPEVQQHYMKLLKRAEVREKLLDSDDDEEDSSTPSKPLPDYKKLKEETDLFQSKVESFFKGHLMVKPPEKEESSENDRPIYLPTVDSIDQLQIRRKIVMDRLSKAVPDLLMPLRLTLQDVTRELRELIFTFRLDSKNILFKPAEWTLVALILFRLLSVKMKQVEEAFKQSSFVHFCSVLLEGLGHSQKDIDTIVDQLISKDYNSKLKVK